MGLEFLKLLTFIMMIPSFNLLHVGFDGEASGFRRRCAGIGLLMIAGFLGMMMILLG